MRESERYIVQDKFDKLDSKIEYRYYILGQVLFELAAQGLRRVDYDSSSAFEVMGMRIGDEEHVLQDFCDVLHFMINEGVISEGEYPRV